MSALTTHNALYTCVVLPFGMKNAPAYFQRLMNQTRMGLESVVTYIDDVVMFSDTWESHMRHIQAFFVRLADVGLVVNLSECEFGQGQVIYLGHHVGRGEVLPWIARVRAILDFPVLVNCRQLMRILGRCGFYRIFVPNFATVTSPLTNLLQKGVKWIWSPECQLALDAVKALLSCEPVLVAPDFSQPFCLVVDASNVGAGHDGLERTMAYFSRKCNHQQKNYCTIEKEVLALVLAVQHFEIYASSVAGDVLVYIDHNPLTFLASFQRSNAFESLVLQPYSLKVKHMTGKENVITDAHSRSGALICVKGPWMWFYYLDRHNWIGRNGNVCLCILAKRWKKVKMYANISIKKGENNNLGVG